MYQASTHFYSWWRHARHTSLLFLISISIVGSYLSNVHAQSVNLEDNAFVSKKQNIIERRVAKGADDAEEQVKNGNVFTGSDDLEMVYNPNKGNQIIGIRFSQMNIPANADIKAAYLEFTAEKKSTVSTSLTISLEASDNASAFVQKNDNISGRNLLSSSVHWRDVDGWRYVNATYRSPDLSAMVQQIVNRKGWQSGNAMAFVIRGNGQRSTYSYDGARNKAPLLHVEYKGVQPSIHTINAAAGDHGRIEPQGKVSVAHMQDKTFTMSPDQGYRVSDVMVDGKSVGAVKSYTFESVAADHTILVKFTNKKNQFPMADAGPDQNVEEGAEVMLSGQNSFDLDDGIAGFLWEQMSGPKVELNNSESEVATFATPDVAEQGAALVFKLTVTDFAGFTSQDACIVNVAWINMPPVAGTGPDQMVAGGAKVILDGSSSSDPDDGIQSFNWVQKSGTPVELVNADSAAAQFMAPENESETHALVFELTVTDQGGLKSSTTTIVNVSGSDGVLVAEAGPDQTVKSGLDVALDGSNSYAMEDEIVSYHWTQTTGIPVVLSDSSAIKPVFNTPEVDSTGIALTFRLTITSKKGLKAQDICIVNVVGDNTPPLANAGTDMTVSPASKVALDGSGSSDQDGGITLYQWRQTSGPVVILSGSGTAAPTFTAPNADESDVALTFSLIVTDTGGLQARDEVIINVSGGNMPPVADAGMDQRVKSGVHVILNGSWSSDPDDGIVSYQWVQVAGPPVILNTPKDMTPSFAAPMVSESGVMLVFTLTVTDKGGLKNSDICEVVVDAGSQSDTTAPEVIITAPVDSGVYETTENRISISGTASDDSGIATVSWTNSNGDEGVADGTDEWTIDSMSLVQGDNVITVIATDTAGNKASAQLIITYTEKTDKQPPVIVIHYPNTTGFFDTDQATVDIEGTSRDDDDVEKVTWKNSHGDSGEAIGTDKWAIHGLKLYDWFNVISVTATDFSGNSTTAEITILRWPFSIF